MERQVARLLTLADGLNELVIKSGTRVGFEVRSASSFQEAVGVLEDSSFDLICMDLGFSGGQHVLNQICKQHHKPDVLVFCSPSLQIKVYAKLDIAALLMTPLRESVLINALQYFLRKSDHRSAEKKEAWDCYLGVSEESDKIRLLIRKLADFQYPVLIQGETGSGKERVARALHAAKLERTGPFVTIDCGSISHSLIESELFGHTKGAFTGADYASKGLLAEAEGGTVFFDEIGELPLAVQTKLLRTLQEKEVRPLGSNKQIPLNIHVLAASNQDLKTMVVEKRFREDLYYRLAAITVVLPALHKRREDISFIADDFLGSIINAKPLSIESHLAMKLFDWPGNIRQLQNSLVRACALSENKYIEPQDLFEFLEKPEAINETLLSDAEKNLILRTIASMNNDKAGAAKRLGIGKTTLYRKLKEYEGRTGS